MHNSISHNSTLSYQLLESIIATLFHALIIPAIPVGYLVLILPCESQIGVCGNAEIYIPAQLQENL